MSRLILDKQAIGLAAPSTQHIMLVVILALLPGTFAYAYFISPGVVLNVVVAVVAAVILEAFAVRLRKQSGLQIIQDGSIALAAFLLALAVPPTLPFWQLIVGVLIMVMLGKHVYGGIGHNPFNPAMVGYAALMVSFPQNMTLWLAPGEYPVAGIVELTQLKLRIAPVLNEATVAWDGITRATPLEHIRSQRIQSLDVSPIEIKQRFLQSGWLPINLAFLLGGLFLLIKKVIRWHIPVSVIGSFMLLSFLFAGSSLPLHHILFSGALILGAFFIATDPVTTASSNRGRLIFGAGVGTLTFIIREFGGYPEGIAFAVLLMNLCVPLIDHLDARAG